MILRKYIPKELEVRIKKRFAFFPVELAPGRSVWLQFYFVKYRFESSGYYDALPLRQLGRYMSGAFWAVNALALSWRELPFSLLDNYGHWALNSYRWLMWANKELREMYAKAREGTLQGRWKLSPAEIENHIREVDGLLKRIDASLPYCNQRSQYGNYTSAAGK